MKNILRGMVALIVPAFFTVFLVACGSGGGGGSDSNSSSDDTQSDTTNPSLVSADPLQGATNVPLTKASISFTFDEAMGTGYSFSWSGNGVNINANNNNISWSPDKKTVTLTLAANLPANSQITWVLNPATHEAGFKDLSGNPLPETTGSFATQTGAWSFSTIDSNVIANGSGSSTSLAFDSNGKMHIAYRDMVNEDLKYATNASGAWVTSTIDSTGDVGMFCQLSLDSNNKVHISYSDNTTRALKYTNNVSGTWVISAIDSGGWYYYSSIAIDSNNKVHISYGSISGQMYITNVSGAWVKSAISGMGGYESSIAVDTNNNVHIAGMGKYATNASGVWVTIAIVTVGSSNLSSSIAIDNNNKVHIGYTHSDGSSTSSYVVYATNTSGAWVTTTLATSVVGTWYTGMSMTVDANNKLHLCYQYVDNASSDDGLQYATNVSGSWVISGSITQGMAPSIKLDSSNKVDISFMGSFIGLQIAHLN